MHYDRAFYINLDGSLRRQQAILRSCRRAGLTDVERFPAIDGRQVDLAPYKAAAILTAEMEVRMAGSLGCFLSHITTWQMIHADPACEIGLIIEDDARLKRSFLTRLQAIAAPPGDWDMIWLGYFRAHGEAVDRNFLRPDFPSRRSDNSGHFCYLVRSDSVPKLLRVLTPYDNRNSKDVLLRKRFDQFNAYFLRDKIATSSRRSPFSDRKRANARGADGGFWRGLWAEVQRKSGWRR
jgi:GR25 family glycosyltransferase involved in LPS biosynthesis